MNSRRLCLQKKGLISWERRSKDTIRFVGILTETKCPQQAGRKCLRAYVGLCTQTHKYAGTLKTRDWKTQDWKTWDQIAGVEKEDWKTREHHVYG